MTMLAGTKLPAGLGTSTVLPDFDFETYSEAGYVWDESKQAWTHPVGGSSANRGLPLVGAAVYTQHPTCEVLSLYFDLKDGRGRQHWRPGLPPPQTLFDYLATGGLIEAFNVAFEAWVWDSVCVPRLGWPPIPPEQLRCAMAKARSFALPGALGKAAEVLGTRGKDGDGDRLIRLFSVPQKPTKANGMRRRVRPEEEPVDGPRLSRYNEIDIEAEAEVSARCPDLNPIELALWLADQRINRRGVHIDLAAVEASILIVQEAHRRAEIELRQITGGAVESASQVQRIVGWLAGRCTYVDSLDEDAVEAALASPMLPPDARRVLEIRRDVGSAAVKKLFALRLQTANDGRLHDLFVFHSARTGRWAGRGAQPQNLPNSGPDVLRCGACGRFNGAHRTNCAHCAAALGCAPDEWGAEAVEDALKLIAAGSLDLLTYVFGSALPVIAGCLRGMFTAAPGHLLIGSDYSAIEAVVAAELTGEEWRREVFRTHGKIYEMSAAKITGTPFEEYAAYKQRTGRHHPTRKSVGKVAELASGYQGWVGAWRAFGADGTDDELKRQILAWREASPSFVEMWGGQQRKVGWNNYAPELFGLEGMFIKAVQQPGAWHTYRSISYMMHGDAVYCHLPSGRLLTYHRPRLTPSARTPGTWSTSYEGMNTNPKNGAVGWIRMETWGGRLFENVVQAVARDVLAHALPALEAAGYAVVLHVHDEIIVEVPGWYGPEHVEEVERIMSTMPPWAADWPIRAAGGWIGRRYRKD